MIIRVWTAEATPDGAAKTEARFAEQKLPELRRLDGFRGATLLRRLVGDRVELVLLTRWQSMESIRAFAGDDINLAVVAEDAKEILTRFDEHVRHYEVALED